MTGYKLDAGRHAQVRSQLDLRDAAAGAALLTGAMPAMADAAER
jgi:hypothetical protein